MTHTDTRARRPQNEPLAVQVLTAQVRSETDPAKAYQVTLPYCPCKDFFFKRGNLADPLCKHLKAAMGLTPQGGTRLDEDTAIELLVALKVRPTTALSALMRTRNGQGLARPLAEAGIAGITYHPSLDLYDIVLVD